MLSLVIYLLWLEKDCLVIRNKKVDFLVFGDMECFILVIIYFMVFFLLFVKEKIGNKVF